MNNAELIAAVSEEAKEPKTVVKRILEACATVKTRTLAAGEDVTIAGEGRLTVRRQEGRKARNPRTGEEVQIPARNAVKFIPIQSLKDAINR